MQLIDIIDQQDINGYFYYYITMMKDFIKQGNQVTLTYQEENKTISHEAINDITKHEIQLFAYKNESELIKFCEQFPNPYINTFYEKHILLKNRVKKALKQAHTSNPEVFINKHLQRKILAEKAPHTSAQFIHIKQNEIPKEENFTLQFPVFIKPTGGMTSLGAAKIDNFEELKTHLYNIGKSFKTLQEENLHQTDILIEEYIEGNLYAMSYFVDEEWKAHTNKIMKQGDQFGTETHLIYWEISEPAHQEIDQNQFTIFAQETCDAAEIKNTFICHQFKKTPNEQLKTIEINGRIWGFNVETYQLSFDFNFLDQLQTKDITYNNKNTAFFRFYPKKTQTFQGYNKIQLQKIEKLSSKYRFYTYPKRLGEKIGTPKDGHLYYGVLILHHADREQFLIDLAFVKENYFSLLH